MTTRAELAARAAELAATEAPFVWATVVRAERPTSAKPGDAAIVLADGEMEGFVGGDCAESTVRAEALAVLGAGRARLLRISPEPGQDVPPDVVARHNPCLSGGALEIFLEPSVPLPAVLVFGRGPIAQALLRADRMFGQSVRALAAPDGHLPPGLRAVVVASHGADEAVVLERALRAGVAYVGLVASRRRAATVLGALAVDDDERTRVHSPAGLDIGARTPQEVALSILAEIVQVLRSDAGPADAAPPDAAPPEVTAGLARDPVCGMSVATVPASLHLASAAVPSGTVWFCGPGCRDAYRDDPTAYPPLTVASSARE